MTADKYNHPMKPILFSTPMVQAIIAGRKKQTRRIVKPQPNIEDPIFPCKLKAGECNEGYVGKFLWPTSDGEFCDFAPLGKEGDILYVRETFIDSEDYPCADYHEDPENEPRFIYRADVPEGTDISHLTWRPSIHMPAEAARLFLRITNVRVERLQDISEEDAIAEGIEQVTPGDTFGYRSYAVKETRHGVSAHVSFRTLWDSIYGNWDSATWVWVYTFERIEKPNV